MKWARDPFYEPVTENPYLADFYRNRSCGLGFPFTSLLFNSPLAFRRKFSTAPEFVIQDRSVYEDAEIFAQNLYDQGNIQDRDFKTYRELYETAVQFLPPPDLVIYFRASVPTLLEIAINSRGRTYERTIAPEYLQT